MEFFGGFSKCCPTGPLRTSRIPSGSTPQYSTAKRQVAQHLEFYGGPIFDRIEQAFASASGHEALLKALDERIAEYVDEGWSFDCSYVWAALVNPSDLLDSTIEIRISESDLVYIATAEEGSDDEHAYDAQKVAHNRSWDDLDLENTCEHRRENGLIRRKSVNRSWEYEDTKFSDPESIEIRHRRPDRCGGRGLPEPQEILSYNPRSSPVRAYTGSITTPRWNSPGGVICNRLSRPLSRCYRTTRPWRCQLTASSSRSSPQNNSRSTTRHQIPVHGRFRIPKTASIGWTKRREEDVMPEASANTADLFEIIRTTRSMRRLKPDPVPNELIRKILEAGVCAPSGGNMQRWRFLVIRDPKVKETVGALYKRAWDEQVAPRYRSGEPAPGMSRERFLRLLDAAEYLASAHP